MKSPMVRPSMVYTNRRLGMCQGNKPKSLNILLTQLLLLVCLAGSLALILWMTLGAVTLGQDDG